MGTEMVAFLESVLSGLDCLDCLAEKGENLESLLSGLDCLDCLAEKGKPESKRHKLETPQLMSLSR